MKKIMSSLVITSLIGLGVSGCANLSSQQQANLQLQLELAKQIGVDAVKIWCATSGVVYVVANDIDAQSRVASALHKNAQAASDACPMIAKITGIDVLTSDDASKMGLSP